MSRQGPPTDTQRLVLENMGFIRQRVAQHIRAYNRWELFDEVLQEALVGACKAATTYRTGAGAKFTTWCTLEVDAAVHRAMRQLPHTITPPRIGRETAAFADGERGYRRPMRAMRPESIEAAAGVKHEEEGMRRFAASQRSLTLIREQTTTHGDAEVESRDAARLCMRARHGIANHLRGDRDKSRRVDVFLRVFFGELQSEIADELGVSRQTISAMVARVQPAFDAWAAEIRSEAA